jgi:hypothetical protein
MPDALTLTMLPAKEGDCLHVAYGEAPHQKHILIDAGRKWTWNHALKTHLADNGINRLELVVVTHVDRDHIDGMLAMLSDPTLNLEVKGFWFNTWDHLLGNAIVPHQNDDETERFGAKMGEELSTYAIDKRWPWNQHFNGKAVEVSENTPENIVQLDNVTLTLLSPDRTKLEALKPTWKKECEKAGLTPGATVEDYVLNDDDDIEAFGAINIDELAAEPFEEDSSKANGASIAFILEYKGVRVLLSGDAHVDLLVKSLEGLGASATNPLQLDAFKVPHHGSKYNISNELLGLVNCRHYLISTNGNYFKHPEDVAIARIIKHGTAGSVLNFNYKTDFNKFWKNAQWEAQYDYSTNFPDVGEDGFLTLSLPDG